MKSLNLQKMESISAGEAGFVDGLLCGASIAFAVGTGGWGWAVAIAGCAWSARDGIA